MFCAAHHRLALTLVIVAVAGCMPQQPFYFNAGNRNGELSHYVDLATQIEQPDVNERPPGEVEGALRPLSLDQHATPTARPGS